MLLFRWLVLLMLLGALVSFAFYAATGDPTLQALWLGDPEVGPAVGVWLFCRADSAAGGVSPVCDQTHGTGSFWLNLS